MTVLTERPATGQVMFMLPEHNQRATVKVNGSTVTVASQGAFSVTLAAPAVSTDIVEVTYTPMNQGLSGAASFQTDSAGGVSGLAGQKASGIPFPFLHPIRTIATIGDSVPELGTVLGLDFATPANITGVVQVKGSLTCPSGTGLLKYSAANSTLTWAAPGETDGTPVLISEGIFVIPSSVPEHSVRVEITSRLLPSVDKQDSLASSVRRWRRDVGGFLYATDALTFGRFRWLPPFAIGAETSVDGGLRYDQALNSGADLLIDRFGGNDSISGNMTVSASMASRTANWDRALSMGIPIIVMLLSPRTSAVITAAKRATIMAMNAAARAEAAKRPGCYVVDVLPNTVDPTTGYAKTNYSSDGVHFSGGLAYETAVILAGLLNTLAPDDRFFQSVGLGGYYDAVNNPSGSLLVSNQGAFAGTGGPVATGITKAVAWAASTVTTLPAYCISSGNFYMATRAGTTGVVAPNHVSGDSLDGTVVWRFVDSGVTSGIADGITPSRSGTLVATAYKVTDINGGPDWQAFACSGATTKGDFLKMFFGSPNIANFAAGDLIDLKFEFKIQGAGVYGMYADAPIGGLTGGAAILWDARQLSSVEQGIRPGTTGVLGFEPMVWSSGITDVTPRIFVESLVAANFVVYFRNADMHKVF